MELILTTKEDIEKIVTESLIKAIEKVSVKEKKESKLLYNMKDLAKFLGVSVGTAQDMKNRDMFPYFQDERTLIFNTDEIWDALKEYMKDKKGRC